MDKISYSNKSTENLLGSDGSIDELVIPPLKLKSKANQSDASSTSSNRQTNASEQAKSSEILVMEQTDIHVKEAELGMNRPVPAVRKSVLIPIAAHRQKTNYKDIKNNQNQLTQQIGHSSTHSDNVMEIIDERDTIRQSTSNESDKVSDLGLGTEKVKRSAFTTKLTNNIELTTLTKNVRKQIEKRFVPEQISEETTSFISHQKMNENEDNVESPSHSDQYEKSDLPTKHETESAVSKKEINRLVKSKKESDAVKRKLKRKETKRKITNEKHIKKHQPPEAKNKGDTEHEAKQLTEDQTEKYDFSYLIGIWLHTTSALKFDPLIRQPRIRISVYDVNTQRLLMKSNPLRNAVLNYEPTHVNFIQPILSDKCTFKESR